MTTTTLKTIADALAPFDLHDREGLADRVHAILPDEELHPAELLAKAVEHCRDPVLGACGFEDLTWRIGPHPYGLPWVNVHLHREGDDEWTAFRAIAPYTPESLQRDFQDALPHSAMVTDYLEVQLDDEDRKDAWHRMARDANAMSQRLHDAATIRTECGAQAIFHDAIAAGDRCIASAALQLGAGLNLPDENGNTVMHRAVLVGQATLIPWLVENGAWVDVTNRDGRTPLHLAASRHDKLACIELLEAGANMDRVDAMGMKPADLAREKVKQRDRGFGL